MADRPPRPCKPESVNCKRSLETSMCDRRESRGRCNVEDVGPGGMLQHLDESV